MKYALLFCSLAMGFALCGCAVLERAGIALFYKRADLSETQVRYDIPYLEGSTSPKQRLDLFVAQGHNNPVFVFVHGGGWTKGDKSLRVGGADVYGNIGRFYAARGIMTAVISYRLQPSVRWPGQVDDVAAAVAWIHSHAAEFGGNPARIFLGGHSAGAQLVTRLALDPAPLKAHGLTPANLCGVISVSGAGLDLVDPQSYKLGESIAYYQERFGSENKDWQRVASPVTYATPGAPPFLILYAAGETKALQRQSQRLSEVLTAKAISNRVVMVAGESHPRMVLTLSRPDRTAGPAILSFIRTTPLHS